MRIVDGEKLVAFYLRERGFRVVGEPPSDRDSAWVKCQLITTDNRTRPDYLVRYLIQADCYAGKDGGLPEAVTLALDVRAALEELVGERDQGTVTASRNVGQLRSPDASQAFEPARERVILQQEVFAHPNRVAA